MPNLNDVLKDPDFWGDQTTDEDRKTVLSHVDKKFSSMGTDEKDRFLANLAATRQRQQKMDAEAHEARAQEVMPKIQNQEAKKTAFEQFVAPATNAVGAGIEAATSPLVGLARMIKGEGAGAAFGPETFTASHPETANQVASGIVPQSPWQAGAMAAQFIPGIGAASRAARLAPAVGRVAASGIGAAGLQGLLGTEGLLEGNTNPVGEAVSGGLKGAATQAAGEQVGKLLGGANRAIRGRNTVISKGDVARVQGTVGGIVPEFAAAGKGPQQVGTFYTGGQGAEQAAGGAFKKGMDALEQKLVQETGQPYIDTPGLRNTYTQLARAVKNEPLLVPQIAKLSPGPGGFLPSQAAEIVALARQHMNINPTAMGKVKQTGMDELVQEIEQALPRGAKGMFSSVRDAFAKAKGIQELMSPAFRPGKKGYQFDIARLQKDLSENPDLANRFAPGELEKLISAATRGASTKPGFMDIPAGKNTSVPYPSKQGVMVASLRNLLSTGRHIGELPGTLPKGAKAGLGVAATATAGQKKRKQEED